MAFDWSLFGEVCLFAIPMVILLSALLSAGLNTLARRTETGVQLVVLVSYLLCVGVVVHEAAHRLFCALFGVQVRETRYFRIERIQTGQGEVTSIGGYIDCEEVESVITGIFLGIAPILVNGTLVAVACYYCPLLEGTSYYWLVVYLIVALGLGARPSRQDFGIWATAMKRAPLRGFLELCLLCGGGILLGALAIYAVDLWITLTCAAGFFVLLIFQGRSKADPHRKRQLPRT